MAVPSPIRSLRTALAGGWSPLGAALAGALGTGYLVGLAWLVLWLAPHPLVGPGRSVITVTIGGSEVALRGIAAKPASTAALSALLRRPEATLDGWPGGGSPLSVPAIYIARLPDDLKEIPSNAKRKRLFVATVLPLVLAVNERLREMRARLVALRGRHARGEPIPDEDAGWLARTAASFDVAPEDFDALLRRVDVVPAPLAIAQAAIESAWGTSRFAREGNALFGQWTFEERRGLVPKARAETASHRVRRFDRLVDSVASYVHNLNTHAAYAEFRRLRAALRSSGKPIVAIKLAPSLKPYSERGAAYVEEIRGVIRHNRLDRLRDARLSRLARD